MWSGSKAYTAFTGNCNKQRKQEVLSLSGLSICFTYSLQSLFLRPNFYNNCELWRKCYATDNESLSEVYEGLIWREFQQFDGKDFFNAKYSLGFILNIDWFQPFKHRVYSIGVIYLAVMNLPRSIALKERTSS